MALALPELDTPALMCPPPTCVAVMLPEVLDGEDCAALGAVLEKAREPLVTVDLQQCIVRRLDGWSRSFSVPAERRMALLEGLDEIDVILRMEADIDAFQRADRQRRPWIYLDRAQ